MCGIMGFIGSNGATPSRETFERVLRDTDKRGGHAWGLAAIDHRQVLHMYKKPGRTMESLDQVWSMVGKSQAFILHTRWATHGDKSNNLNNHPHSIDGGWLIHNGVVSNYKTVLKHTTPGLISQCDSEVICRLGEQAAGRLPDRMQAAVDATYGNLAIAALWRRPTCLVLARRGNPLHTGRGQEGFWFSSTGVGIPDAKPMEQDKLHEYRLRDGVAVQYRKRKLMHHGNYGGGTTDPSGRTVREPIVTHRHDLDMAARGYQPVMFKTEPVVRPNRVVDDEEGEGRKYPQVGTCPVCQEEFRYVDGVTRYGNRFCSNQCHWNYEAAMKEHEKEWRTIPEYTK